MGEVLAWGLCWLASLPYQWAAFMLPALGEATSRETYFNIHDNIGLVVLFSRVAALTHVFWLPVLTWQFASLRRARLVWMADFSGSVAVALLFEWIWL